MQSQTTRFLRLLLTFSFCLLTINLSSAQQAGDYTARTISDEQAAQEAKAAQDAISAQLHEDFTLTPWATESLVADPITLFIDDNGTAYIARTNRQKNSEFDIRGHRDWMIRSIGFKTVEDRRAFLHAELSPERSDLNGWLEDVNGDGSRDWRDLTIEKEHIYKIEDTDGDGMADTGLRIVDDFHDEVTDVAGAVMAYKDDLFVGVGPDMWRMQDTDGDGVMDQKTSISHGYAIHIGFSGHGMSGVTMGPDGRVYWGIGDIGFHGTDQTGKLWDYSNEGVIVRSNPDGSDFEVFAHGVRNTHEFVFDAYGNLISVDNDGDHAGESERLVYIVNGSDSGWRANWQYGKYIDPDNNEYKVWMDEELFKPRFEGQAAYITAPVANYHAGPTGMTYNPGTALSKAWNDYFFIAEFRGTPTNSHVYAFKLNPKGATFELDHEKTIVGGLLTTGLEFGPDGALYAADWIDGWGTKNAGRIWKFDVKDDANETVREEVKTLLGASFADLSEKELGAHLAHADMRVRQKAQFELATRGKKGLNTLRDATKQKDMQFARIHGIWGLGQMARANEKGAADAIVPLLKDSDPEIRAQAAKQLGDFRYEKATRALIPLLKDENARARFFAAEALGRIEAESAVEPIIAMLEANDDEDAYLRHAGSMALARIGKVEPILALSDHSSRALRIAAVVTLRKLRHPGIARFLTDEDEYIVTEAARAINDDKSIEEALPDLARVLEDPRFTSEPLLRRAINANLRLGRLEDAQCVANFANRASAPEEMRAEALAALSVWSKPSVLDRVDGFHRGPVERDPAIVQGAVGSIAESVLNDRSATVRIAATDMINKIAFAPAAATLETLLKTDPSAEVRVAALKALGTIAPGNLDEVIQIGLADDEATVRMTGLSMIPDLTAAPAQKVEMLSSVFEDGTTEEQQYALNALGEMQDAKANTVLSDLIGRLETGNLGNEILLELEDAVKLSGNTDLVSALETYKAAQPTDDPLVTYADALAGGNEQRGRMIFYRNPTAQCIRCHAVGSRGGEVGPNLEHIGSERSREELLVSLVDPSAYVRPGYGLVTLTFADDTSVTGTLMEEDDQFLVIKSGDSEPVRMAKADIKKRVDAPSSMPPMGEILDRKDVRDLVEFLVNLK